MIRATVDRSAMTIAKGQPWGQPVERPDGVIQFADDASLADGVHQRLEAGTANDTIYASVGAGDVQQSLGYEGEQGPGETIAYPFDLAIAQLGSTPDNIVVTVPFVANLLGYRRRRLVPAGLQWPSLMVMNTPLASSLRLGPKAHPNDGRLDLTIGSISIGQRSEARRRAQSGAHLPHPDLQTRRVSDTSLVLDQPLHIVADGRYVGRWAWLGLSTVADAFVLIAG